MKLEKKHWWWIAGLTTAGIITGVVIYRRRNRPKINEKSNEQGQSQGSQGSNQKGGTPSFPMKQGARGYNVKVLQQYMNSTCASSLKQAGVYPLAVDGIWGSKTEAGAKNCYSVNTNQISKTFYDRMVRDLTAAKVLPKG